MYLVARSSVVITRSEVLVAFSSAVHYTIRGHLLAEGPHRMA